MPSPWVRRAQGSEVAADGTTLRLPPKSYDRHAGMAVTYRELRRGGYITSSGTTADEMVADVRSSFDQDHASYGGAASPQAGDPADSAGTVQALRAFGIVR